MKDVQKADEGKVSSHEARGLTWKTILVGIVVMIFLARVVVISEITTGNPVFSISDVAPTTASLAPVLIIILVVNTLFKKVKKRVLFSRQELVVLYILLLVGGTIMSKGFFSYFIFKMTGLQFLALTSPATFQPILDSFPGWLIPKSDDAVAGFFMGSSTVPWSDWIVPMIIWAAFFGVIFFALLCVAVFFRKRWTVQEQLVFPLTIPILRFTEEPKGGQIVGSLWKNSMFLIGCLVSFIIVGSQMLNRYFPVVPMVMDRMFMGRLVQRMVRGTRFEQAFMVSAFMPAVDPINIGVGYFVSMDLLFSSWFFYMIFKYLMFMGFELLGILDVPAVRASHYPQITAGMFGLGLYLIWMSRNTIKELIRGALAKNTRGEAEDEPMSLRLAFFGGLGSIVILVAFMFVVLKISPLISLLYLIIFFSGMIALARFRTEAGVGYQTGFGIWYEQAVMQPILGVGIMDSQVMSGMGFIHLIGRGAIGSATGTALEAFKIADETGMKKREMTKTMLFGFVAAIVIVFAVGLPYIYEHGANTMNNHFIVIGGQYTWSLSIPQAMRGEPQPNLYTVGFFFGGMFFTVLLMYLKSVFYWWPFHPIGYVISMGFGWEVAGSFLIAWLLKLFILRYGGAQLYRKLIPAALGLIAGEMLLRTVDAIVVMLV